MLKRSLLILGITTILFQNFLFYSQDGNEKNVKKKVPLMFIDYSKVRDTLYTLKSSYIEVNLKKQLGILHIKNDTSFTFKISSGTKRLEKGIDTNEGLYVIQSMVTKIPSKQFDSTILLNWMGFNFGVGFHALESSGYYRYLGVKPSSHGCIRISKNDAKELYTLISLGTPVLIHNENNAVIIDFADSTDDIKRYKYSQLKSLLKFNMDLLYRGDYLFAEKDKMIIDNNNVHHSGLPIGDNTKIPDKPSFNSLFRYVEVSTPDILKVKPLPVKKNNFKNLIN